MTSLISCHLMNGIMDCIQICFFCTFCQIYFTSSSAVLSLYTHFQILLCAVCYNFAQQFSDVTTYRPRFFWVEIDRILEGK